MSIRKAKICDALYDIIDYEEYIANKAVYSTYVGRIAVDYHDGYVYPLRTVTDIRPGCYNFGGVIMMKPPFGNEAALYSAANIINFSDAKNLREVIEAQDKFNRAERSILTSIDSITIPEIKDSDTPAMKALKEAILLKHIDLDKYDYRFGIENYPNDKRLLKRDSITLPKLVTYAEALDIALTLTLADKSADVPNPIGKTITVQLNGNPNDAVNSEEEE